eukprot:Em0019g666a
MDTPTDLDQRIDFVNNETLEATRRIRNVAEETNDIGSSCRKDEDVQKVYGKGANITAEEDAIVNQQPASQSSSGRPNGPIIKSVTNDKKEEEMEENMQ